MPFPQRAAWELPSASPWDWRQVAPPWFQLVLADHGCCSVSLKFQYVLNRGGLWDQFPATFSIKSLRLCEGLHWAEAVFLLMETEICSRVASGERERIGTPKDWASASSRRHHLLGCAVPFPHRTERNQNPQTQQKPYDPPPYSTFSDLCHNVHSIRSVQ